MLHFDKGGGSWTLRCLLGRCSYDSADLGSIHLGFRTHRGHPHREKDLVGKRGSMLHGNDAGAARKFCFTGGAVQFVRVVSLTIVQRVSLLGELNFDLAELAVEVLVRGIVGERVIVRSLLGGSGDCVANSVGVEEGLSARCGGELQESVSFGGFLGEGLHVRRDRRSGRDYASGGKVLRPGEGRADHAAGARCALPGTDKSADVYRINRDLRFGPQIGYTLDLRGVVWVVESDVVESRSRRQRNGERTREPHNVLASANS